MTLPNLTLYIIDNFCNMVIIQDQHNIVALLHYIYVYREVIQAV